MKNTNWLYTDKECQSIMFLDKDTFIPGEWCEECNCKKDECPYKKLLMQTTN